MAFYRKRQSPQRKDHLASPGGELTRPTLTDYPTETRKRLERIIRASNPATVLDCFIGPGLPPRRAEAGPRWIGATSTNAPSDHRQAPADHHQEQIRPEQQPPGEAVETEDAPPDGVIPSRSGGSTTTTRNQHNEAVNLARAHRHPAHPHRQFFDGSGRNLVKIILNHPLSPLDLDEIRRN